MTDEERNGEMNDATQAARVAAAKDVAEMTHEFKATMNDEAEFAEHMVDDCKVDPDEMMESWKGGRSDGDYIELDPDELLAEEQAIRERRLEEDKERRERRTKAAKCLRDRAEALVAQAAEMRERAELLDPAPCAGGAPRKPVVRKSRKTAVGPKKAAQRRAKAAAPAKAPRPQRKAKRAAAGGSGGKAKATGNGAAKREPREATKPTEPQVRAHLRYHSAQAITAAAIAKLLRCDAKQVSAVLRPMVASGEVKAEGKTRGRVYWLA